MFAKNLNFGNPFGSSLAKGLQALRDAQGGSSEHARCCPAFQLEGEFLLDTSTGRVWKYDEKE